MQAINADNIELLVILSVPPELTQNLVTTSCTVQANTRDND